MKCHDEKQWDAHFPYESVHTAGKTHQELATAVLPFAGARLLPNADDEQTCTDYSEEAIPERDPAYCLPDGTLNDTQTAEYLPAAERRALARYLEQLGMSATMAAMVANL
jgi:hypothetical protein